MKQFVQVVLFIMILIVSSGCANKNMQAKESGFFKNYENMEKSDKLQGTRVYFSDDADFSKYENIYISPIKIIAGSSKDKLSDNEKLLFRQMEDYLTDAYKQKIKDSSSYKIVESKNAPNTLIYEGTISAIEIHYDDLGAMDVMPMMLIVKAFSRATYKDASVRILGEGRLIDASNNKVLIRMIRLHKGKEVKSEVQNLKFSDVSPALDEWLRGASENLTMLSNGIMKRE